MPEDGTVSILRRGPCYQVRYASNNPYGREREPWVCPDEEHVRTLLHHCGIEEATIQQACADVRKGGMAILCLVLSPEQRQRFFRPAAWSASPHGARRPHDEGSAARSAVAHISLYARSL